LQNWTFDVIDVSLALFSLRLPDINPFEAPATMKLATGALLSPIFSLWVVKGERNKENKQQQSRTRHLRNLSNKTKFLLSWQGNQQTVLARKLKSFSQALTSLPF